MIPHNENRARSDIDSSNRKLLEIDEHFSLEPCFFSIEIPELSIRGLLSVGAGGSGHIGPLLDASNDIDEILIE